MSKDISFRLCADTRSPNTGNSNNFCYVNTSGTANNNNASNSNGVACGLCDSETE